MPDFINHSNSNQIVFPHPARQLFKYSVLVRNLTHFRILGMRGGVDWMRKLAFRFRKIKENYNLFRNDIKRLLGPQETETLLNIRQQIESHTDVRNFETFRFF